MPAAPNVFLPTGDALRADAVTEQLRELAADVDGTRFTDAVAPAPNTASAAPAMATGRFVDGTTPETDPPHPGPRTVGRWSRRSGRPATRPSS